LIHQQDAVPGLANKLLVPFAQKITVALPDTVRSFPAGRTQLRGNPVRPRVLTGNAGEGFHRFGLDPDVPLLLVTGGGTGALGLNRIVAEAAPKLTDICQMIHLTGRGRGVPTADLGPRYQQHELIVSEMPHVLAAASLVVSRAGMGTLTELSALRKPTIIVPMPGSHQEENAQIYSRHGAALVLDQAELTPDLLVQTVGDLLADAARRETLGRAIHGLMPMDAAARIADDVLALARRPA
jgi:UDP-N-acetylglucosamine--N-acetylmuramyl-(pentapeptide) pyrophosphoryl-undecaprenol N-acetylglucosamine transferase